MEANEAKARKTRCRSCAGKGKAIPKKPRTGQEKVCPYCDRKYVGKSDTCSRRCASRKKRNEDYFGGHLLDAVGWKEQVCQMCFRPIKDRPQVHHVRGHPDHSLLVTLHAGCHEVLSHLVLQGKTVDPTYIRRLEWYAEAQRDKKLPTRPFPLPSGAIVAVKGSRRVHG